MSERRHYVLAVSFHSSQYSLHVFVKVGTYRVRKQDCCLNCGPHCNMSIGMVAGMHFSPLALIDYQEQETLNSFLATSLSLAIFRNQWDFRKVLMQCCYS